MLDLFTEHSIIVYIDLLTTVIEDLFSHIHVIDVKQQTIACYVYVGVH